MVWTKSLVAQYSEGNGRVRAFKLTADAATQNVDTGLSVIDYFMVGPCSLATGAPHVYANSSATGIATAGVSGCSGFVSGDEIFVKVFGR